MMPVLHFAMQPAVQAPAAAGDQPQAATSAMATAAASASARQAAADAITAASSAAAMPLAARLLQGVPPAPGEAAAPKAPADTRQAAATVSLHAGNGTAAQPAAAAVTMPAAQDGSKQSGQDGQPQGDNGASFRGVLAAAAPAANTNAAADTVKLVGNPEQWQQPLRAALGDRLQLTLQKGNDQAVNQAVIRLEPPNLGSIEISIRQSAGALHVSMSATNSEVVRQLNAVGDSMRQDLSQRQQGDVAVTVSQASSRSLADSEGRGRQPEREAEQQREQRGPGRALNEGDDTNTTFAMLRE
jgi:flagellar hook-length control protein FliK